MTTIVSELDHIVIVAEALEEGVDFCQKALGVQMRKGGEHVRVGTHNYLLNLDQGIYLEVIAINPSASAISCPRWFGMDSREGRARAAVGPYLATFVARTNDIQVAVQVLPDLGPMREMQRGNLEWEITIPDDGKLVESGAVPTVIQWPEGVHPTQTMAISGCRLESLEVFHPDPERIESMWEKIGLRKDSRLLLRKASDAEAPCLAAHIATPFGTKIIR
ncbi:VOC family protein [Herbaspirillum sp. HC18]|nr:VOC family protein [Herbaspirillum sp. HC18]